MLSTLQLLTLQFALSGFAYANPAAIADVEQSTGPWSTVALTISATTETANATTMTLSATTDVIPVYGAERSTWPGVQNLPSELATVSDSTITQQATTATFAAQTLSIANPPSALQDLLPPAANDLYVIAPTITSLPSSVIAQINADYVSLYNSYTSSHPRPSILAQVLNDLDALSQENTMGIEQNLIELIVLSLNFVTGPTDDVSMSPALSNLLSPYPSLSSEVAAYITAAASYYAPLHSAQFSAVEQAASITNSAAVQSKFSQISMALSTQSTQSTQKTSSSSGAAAAPTRDASVFVNAGLAVVGIAVAGLL